MGLKTLVSVVLNHLAWWRNRRLRAQIKMALADNLPFQLLAVCQEEPAFYYQDHSATRTTIFWVEKPGSESMPVTNRAVNDAVKQGYYLPLNMNNLFFQTLDQLAHDVTGCILWIPGQIKFRQPEKV